MIKISLDIEADDHYKSAEHELRKYLTEELGEGSEIINKLLSGDIIEYENISPETATLEIMANGNINPKIADLIDNLTILTQEYQNQYSKEQIQLCDIINKDHPVHKAIQTKIAADMIMSSRNKDRGFLKQKTVAKGSVPGKEQEGFKDVAVEDKQARFKDVAVENATPIGPDASRSAQATTKEAEISKQQPALKVSSEISAIDAAKTPKATRKAQEDSKNPALAVSSNDLEDKKHL